MRDCRLKSNTDEAFVIGIDIGTSNVKGSLYTTLGNFLAHHSIPYRSHTPQAGYHEQDPEDWVSCIIEILQNLLKYEQAREKLKAVAFSNQGGTVVVADTKSRPLYRAITWMDRRGVEVYEDNEFLQSKNLEFYRKTGWRLDSHISFTPLYWIKKNLNSYFKEIHRIFFVNDYVIYRLSGKIVTDPSNASISLLYNIIEDRWDKEILGYLDISEECLPEVKDSGAVIGILDECISKKLGIKNDVILVNGGHDQHCTSISAGIFKQKQTLLSTGTAWIIFKVLDKPLFDVKSFFAIGRSILKGKFGLLYSLPASGGSIRWFANKLLNIKDEKMFFRFLERNSKKLKELKNDIIYYPYLAGTFDPDFDQNAKASFTGIDISSSGLDFIKAIMEGVSFHIKKVFLAIREKGVETKTIRMVGGGAKDTIWTQITADVLNMEIAVPKYPEEDFAVKGAAILANYGLKRKMKNKFSIYDSYRLFQSEFDDIKPDRDNVNFYIKKYRDFEVYFNKLYSSSR